MSRVLAIVLYVLVTYALATAQGGQDVADVSRAYVCSDIAGVNLVAPDWKAEPDGARGQQVLIQFKDSSELADVKWMSGDTTYYGGTGQAKAMRSGFSIALFNDEFVEMYVFNAGTSELLYTQIRSGNALLPNLMKSFKASCEPVGTKAR